MGGMVTVFDPQGNQGEIPHEQLAAFVKAGGMPAVTMKDPSGNEGYVPANRMQDAYKAGGKLVPFETQEVKHPGFWSFLWDNLKGMAQGAGTMLRDASEARAGNFADAAQDLTQTAIQMDENAQHRRDEGRSLAYRAIAPVGEALGVNVRGMEDAADEGNPAGVLGTAAAVPVAMAATEGAKMFGPRLSTALSESASSAAERIRKVTPKQLAQTAGGVSGGVAGHGTLSAPGAFYGAKTAGKIVETVLGKERANSPIFGSQAADPVPAPAPKTLADLDVAPNKPATPSVKIPARTIRQSRALGPNAQTLQQAEGLRSLSDLNARPSAPAAPEPAPEPAPTPTPKAAPKPKAKAAPKAAPVTPSGDPILDALRQKAADIHAAGETPLAPSPEHDLMTQMLKSLEPENLARLKARKFATQ